MPIDYDNFETPPVEYIDVTESSVSRDLIDERPAEDTTDLPSEEVTFGYTEVEWTY